MTKASERIEEPEPSPEVSKDATEKKPARGAGERRLPRWLLALGAAASFVLGGLILPLTVNIAFDLYQRGRAPLARTEVGFYDPWFAFERPLSVVGRTRGGCYNRSVVNPASQAVQCLAVGTGHDPCWSTPGESNRLLCVRSPWDTEAVLFVKTTGPMRREDVKSAPYDTTPPWALELEDGRRCVFIAGATIPFAGGRLTYGCTRGGGHIVGIPDRTVEPWIVRLLPTDARSTVELRVRRAWN